MELGVHLMPVDCELLLLLQLWAVGVLRVFDISNQQVDPVHRHCTELPKTKAHTLHHSWSTQSVSSKKFSYGVNEKFHRIFPNYHVKRKKKNPHCSLYVDYNNVEVSKIFNRCMGIIKVIGDVFRSFFWRIASSSSYVEPSVGIINIRSIMMGLNFVIS